MFPSFCVTQRAPYNHILATPDYDEWKYMRKMTNPAFSPENIRKVSFASEDVARLFTPKPFATHGWLHVMLQALC